MKRLFFALIMSLLIIPAYAGVKLESGDLGCLYGIKWVPASFNWDKAVYKKSGTLENYLAKAPRHSDWEELCMSIFMREVNKETIEYGTRLSNEKGNDSKYSIRIDILKISGGGDIEGMIYVVNNENGKKAATVKFSSNDADDDDATAFNDQFESVGESFGKLLKKALKKAKKR